MMLISIPHEADDVRIGPGNIGYSAEAMTAVLHDWRDRGDHRAAGLAGPRPLKCPMPHDRLRNDRYSMSARSVF
jgi:hypothetical protein